MAANLQMLHTANGVVYAFFCTSFCLSPPNNATLSDTGCRATSAKQTRSPMARRRVAFGGLGPEAREARRDAVRRHFRDRSMDSVRDSASAGDWSRPGTPSGASQDADDSGSEDEEPAVCADLARERALVPHMHHPLVLLVKRQIRRLESETLVLTPRLSLPAPAALCPAARGPLALHVEHPLLMHALVVLAPVLALLVVVLLSAVAATLGALASPWQPPPPREPSCLSRLLAAFLPSWSSHDDPPLVRPF
ncbi:uncharacterized protein LOC113211316 [Frankliniella occidentalis]|uniref:Uncharacterized protein LOC113211316 n=1 Tax=Frankliniella occidentalis TaxID=133901 RepID=A0A6J1T1I5_FRAOC|nr:uncharacterized protein LOC113211316 [Frankliniella occidentalis]